MWLWPEHQGGDIFMPAVDNRMGDAAAAMFADCFPMHDKGGQPLSF